MRRTKNQEKSELTDGFIKLKESLISIIDESRFSGISSSSIANVILKKTVDNELIVEGKKRDERPMNIEDMICVAKKAIQQAHFDGAFVVLPSGDKIKRKEHYWPQFSDVN